MKKPKLKPNPNSKRAQRRRHKNSFPRNQETLCGVLAISNETDMLAGLRGCVALINLCNAAVDYLDVCAPGWTERLNRNAVDSDADALGPIDEAEVIQ